jgi:glycosyltransferase involved in cell wall biosynthesis
MGYDITVYSLATSYSLLGSHEINGVRDRKYMALGPYNLPPPQMFKGVLDSTHDIVHIYSIHALTALAGLLPKRDKLIISPYYHGIGHSKIANVLWTFYKPIAKGVLFKADVIIVNSNAQRKILLKDFRIPFQKTHLVYDGVDVEDITKAPPYEVDGKVILYVGRLERYKGIHLGILALKHLPPKFKLVIIGRGPYEKKLREIAVSNNLKDRVVFLGQQPDEVVWRWLKTASVFIHLSKVESFGMTCVEALAAGTPVVANDDGLGLRETISLFPRQILVYKVDREPISELAKKIELASTMKPVSADVSAFSWNEIVKKIHYIYEKMP